MEDNFSQDQKTLSGILIDALRARSFTVEKLSQLTNVSERAITLLLEERFEELPAAPYVRGYLTKIAEALHLDGEVLWKEYLKDHDRIAKSGARDILPPNRFITTKLNKKWAVAGVIAILLVIYLAVRGPALLGRPLLVVENISSELTVESPTFEIHGRINPSDELTINKEIVRPESNGNFSYTITLQEGFNAVEFRVKNVLGRTTEDVKNIFYKAPAAHSTAPLNNFNNFNNATTEEIIE